MDSALSVLIDGLFYLVGKSVLWLLGKLGLSFSSMSHGGIVLTGFLASVGVGSIMIFLGVRYGWF